MKTKPLSAESRTHAIHPFQTAATPITPFEAIKNKFGIETEKIPTIDTPTLQNKVISEGQAYEEIVNLYGGTFAANNEAALFGLRGKADSFENNLQILLEDGDKEKLVIDITDIPTDTETNIPLKSNGSENMAKLIWQNIEKIGDSYRFPTTQDKYQRTIDAFFHFHKISPNILTTGANLNVTGLNSEALTIHLEAGNIVITNGIDKELNPDKYKEIRLNEADLESNSFTIKDLWPDSKADQRLKLKLVKFINKEGFPRIGVELVKEEPTKADILIKQRDLALNYLKTKDHKGEAAVWLALETLDEMFTGENSQLAIIDKEDEVQPIDFIVFDKGITTTLGLKKKQTERLFQKKGRCEVLTPFGTGPSYINDNHASIFSLPYQGDSKKLQYNINDQQSLNGTWKFTESGWIRTSEEIQILPDQSELICLAKPNTKGSLTYFVVNSGSHIFFMQMNDHIPNEVLEKLELNAIKAGLIKRLIKVATAVAIINNESPRPSRDVNQVRILEPNV
jgi:hypothetical protein